MAWLEAHQELRDHPKTKRAARTLGISRPQMIGHMMCLWWWCLDYAEDGNLSDFNNDDIADAAAWDGDPDTFVSALVNCGPADRPGFLISTDTGIEVNDWEEYGGKYVTKRNQGRERQRTYRQRNALVTQDKSVSNTTRVDKRIEDKMSECEAPISANASPTYPPGFEEFESVFKMNLITEVKERDPKQGMMGGFSFDDTSRALLLQVYSKGPILSSKAVAWGIDQWEQSKKDQRFRVQDRGCINWLLTTIYNSYKPSVNGSDPTIRKSNVPATSAAEQAAAAARQAAYEQQIAEELERAGLLK